MACYDAIKSKVAATRSGRLMMYGFMFVYVHGIVYSGVCVCVFIGRVNDSSTLKERFSVCTHGVAAGPAGRRKKNGVSFYSTKSAH